MLNDALIRKARPKEKPYKLGDHSGLYLHVAITGSKLWRFRYRFHGKQKLLALGSWPEISLADARRAAIDARSLLAKGEDPSDAKRVRKMVDLDAPTFEAVAREWLKRFSPSWSASHAKIIGYRLEHYVFPSLGKQAIGSVKAPEILAMLRKIELRGSIETEHRVKIVVGQVMRYAVATGRATHDPTVALKGALPTPAEHHFGALTDPAAVGRLLKLQEAYQGTPSVKAALRLAPLVFVRPGELRGARWTEIDLDRAQWMIPAERMKGQKDHLVPLSRQAVAILRGLIDLRSAMGESPFVFPGYQSKQKPMSETAMLSAYRKMGYRQGEVTAHGWRATARTLLDEQLGFRPDIIEHQLAHAVRDPLGRAYNRTQHLDERRRIMQTWADYLDDLREA